MPKSKKAPKNEVCEGTPAPRVKRRARRLKTLENVRQYVASVLRQAEVEEDDKPLEPTRARLLLYGSSILGQLIKDGVLEARVAAIEEQFKRQGREGQR